MPAARYWRAIGLQSVSGGALELSALHLYLSGVRVDAAATLTCTVAPESGALANLQDDDTATVCRWPDVSAPGFALVWDFGAGNTQDVSAIRLGAGALYAEWLETLTLQYSIDGVVWATQGSVAAFTWPGANTLQATPLDGDSNFSSVSLLLHCDGANGSKALIDTSISQIPMTVSIGKGGISTAKSKFGGACFSTTEGSGSYGYAAAPANTPALIFGMSDFTVEFWVNTSNASQDFSYPRLLSVGDYLTHGGWNLVYLKPNGGRLFLDFYANGGVALGLPCGVLTDNTWHHVAFTRSGNTFRTFLNGVLQATGTSSVNLSVTSTFTIGTESSAISFFSGWFDEIRITKGVARYAANFTPPSVAFPSAGVGGSLDAQRKVLAIPSPVPHIFSGGQSSPAGPVLQPQALRLDMQDGGMYRIYGTVKKKATQAPLRRRVQLLHQRSSRLVRETWSDASTGAYSFDYIKGGPGVRYFVCSFDHTDTDLAVIADQLTPEAMP